MYDLLPICHQGPHLSLEDTPGRSFSVHYRHCGLMRLLQQLRLFPDLPPGNRENALRFPEYAAISHVGLPRRIRKDNNKGPDPRHFQGTGPSFIIMNSRSPLSLQSVPELHFSGHQRALPYHTDQRFPPSF